jgi:hypothetical protein
MTWAFFFLTCVSLPARYSRYGMDIYDVEATPPIVTIVQPFSNPVSNFASYPDHLRLYGVPSVKLFKLGVLPQVPKSGGHGVRMRPIFWSLTY